LDFIEILNFEVEIYSPMVKFTRKKIETLTLGERMKKNREERRLSVSEVAKGTKIQAKYLNYLEEGEYLKLPADVYVKGFLKSYAFFMGLNEESLIKQYIREKGIQRNIKKTGNDEEIKKPINFSSFVLTPKLILLVVIFFVVVGSFWYLYSEVNSFISSPRLIILKPADGAVVEGKNVHISGVAEKDSVLFINDQPVLVNENGEFGEDVGLGEGFNNIIVRAKNRFDKETSKAITVKAEYESNVSMQDAENIQTNDPFTAEIYVSPNATWVSVESDGNLVYSGTLLPNSMQKFEVKEKISVTSAKGNETFIKINEKDLGQISTDSQAVADVQYNFGGKIKKDK
jgi:cytoskeletal protein RodZ